MCRLLAYLGPPATIAELLYEPPYSLHRQSWAPRCQKHGTMNADGFGAGWYDFGVRTDPARYRAARPMWTDRSFASLAGVVRTSALLASVRSATPGLPVDESCTAPYTSGPWLFAHNGSIARWCDPEAPTSAVIRSKVSLERAARIEGATDSEVLFALTLDALDEGRPPADALGRAVATAESLAPGSRCNLLLTDGRRVAAAVWGDTLFQRRRNSAGGTSLTLASEPDDDGEGWEPLPDRSVVLADRDELTVTPLDLGAQP